MILAGRSSNSGFTNDKYKFVGNERDIETGYDYLGGRYYDSRIGKLFSKDPFADKDPSRSPYSYAGNNPITFYDANGDSVEAAYTKIPLTDLFNSEPMYHTLLILTNEETGEVTTIEGMPEYRELGLLGDLIQGEFNSNAWGNLIPEQATLLRNIDPKNRETITTPEGMTDAEFQSNLLKAQENYSSGSKMQYAPFPELKENTANSNSYTYSMLKAAGAFLMPTKWAPGWYINIFNK